MRRNNVAKRFGIASLCLGVAISAFSGITPLTTDVAVAVGPTVKLTDLVTVSEGATVAQETRDVIWKASVTVADQDCLRISSSDAYEATFNQIFQGNTELRFEFPERLTDFADADGVAPTAAWGNFKFTITDAADADNFFDIVYYRTGNGTTLRVEWNGHTVQTNSNNGPTGTTYFYAGGNYYYDAELRDNADSNCAPCFMATASKGYKTRVAKLQLRWVNGVLCVVSNGTQKQDNKDNYASVMAKFDGSYDETAEKCGFVSKSKWGLPKMTFPNGYKISFSSYMDVAEEDRQDATDVSFWRIRNDGTISTNNLTGGAYYNAFADDAFTENNYMKAYDLMEENAGKALLGWKDAENALYPTATALKSADIASYTPIFLGFDTLKGASVRIDPTGGQSGLRFMTLFDKDEYVVAKDYIQSQGTLIAYTDQLTRGRLDAVNYATEITAATTVAQVQNTKEMFDYTVTENNVDKDCKAYSMALIGITDYTQAYSARGYLVVVYADETTQYIYTDYNDTDNSRSIEEVAQMLQQTADYQNYTGDEKGIVDDYAGVSPENQE